MFKEEFTEYIPDFKPELINKPTRQKNGSKNN